MKITHRDIQSYLKPVPENIKSLKLPSSTFAFVTYNRCPFSDFEKNPLYWSSMSLFHNKLYNPTELIFVDDCSNDYTFQTIDYIKRITGRNVRYIRNDQRKGCSYSRKIATELASFAYVFNGDDDCIFPAYFLSYSLISYILIELVDPNIAILNLPVYEKHYLPQGMVDINEVGKILRDKQYFTHYFESFPSQYLTMPQYLDKSLNLLNPFKVDIFKGVNLYDKNKIIQSGNYLDLSMRSGGGYSEHPELAYQLKKFGFTIYHQPDPKCGTLHLKYGSKTQDRFDKRLSHKRFEGIKYSFGEIIQMSEENKFNTGCRQNDTLFHIEEIGSLLSFYLKVSDEYGYKFAKKEYINFVEKYQLYSTTPTRSLTYDERKEIRKKAVELGALITEKQIGKSLEKIKNKILSDIY